MFIIRKLDDLLASILKPVTAGVLFFQVIIIFLGVFFRYALRSPLTWVDELACYLLVFTTFLGGYVAFRENKLASITFIVDKCPRRLKQALVILADLMILVFVAAIAYYGYKLAGRPTILKQKTPSMQLPMIVFFCFIPVSGLLMTVHAIVKTYDAFLGKDLDVQAEEDTVA